MGVNQPVINFTEGKINLGDRSISVASNDKELIALAEEGLIEKREDSGGIYYYLKAEADGMRLGVFISLREKKIEWLRLHWLDSPMKGWNDVSENLMLDEYRLLSDLVKKQVGIPPCNRRPATRTWRFNWGQINVSYEPRSFQADIFMRPR
jgi:DNA-binding transcriptional ArsR family regulator